MYIYTHTHTHTHIQPMKHVLLIYICLPLNLTRVHDVAANFEGELLLEHLGLKEIVLPEFLATGGARLFLNSKIIPHPA